MTWADLIAEVRAQIDVDVETAFAWLLDKARVLNIEAAWLLSEAQVPAVEGQTEYALPVDLLRVEAVLVGPVPYRRATLSQMDQARASNSSAQVYTDAAETSDRVWAINPPVQAGAMITMRYVSDVPEVSDRETESPPFPADITPCLADGAIGQGLARMDERFDSAAYFDARFNDGLARLKRRRHGRVGRGSIAIRVVS